MDQPSLFNLKELLKSLNNGIYEKQREFLKAFQKDGMSLDVYPNVLLPEEWQNRGVNAIERGVGHFLNTTTWGRKWLDEQFPGGKPKIENNPPDKLLTGFRLNQRNGTPSPSRESNGNAEDEAIRALNIYNPISIEEGIEYGGNICRITLKSNNSQRYEHTVTPGTHDSVEPNHAPCRRGTRVLSWHTHSRSPNEVFSRDDKIWANNNDVVLFLGTLTGKCKLFIPARQPDTDKGSVHDCKTPTIAR